MDSRSLLPQPFENLAYEDPAINSRLGQSETQRGRSAPTDTAERLTWVEGLRGLACYGVFNGHYGRGVFRFADNLNPDSPMFGFLAPYLKVISVFNDIHMFIYYDLSWSDLELSRQPIILGEFAVAMFFVLSGRVLASGFLKRPNIENVASALLRRPFRLLIPVFGAHMIYVIIRNWGWYEMIDNMSEEDWPTWIASRQLSLDLPQDPSLLSGILISLSTVSCTNSSSLSLSC